MKPLISTSPLLIGEDRDRWSVLWFVKITSMVFGLTPGRHTSPTTRLVADPSPPTVSTSAFKSSGQQAACPPVSWASLRPPSLFPYLLQAEIQRQSSQPNSQISVNLAKIFFQNIDLRSAGLPCVNCLHTCWWALRVAHKPCRLCAQYLENPSPRKTTRDTSDQAQLKFRVLSIRGAMSRFWLREITRFAHCSDAFPSLCHFPPLWSLDHPSTWLTGWQQLPVQKVGQMNTHTVCKGSDRLSQSTHPVTNPHPQLPRGNGLLHVAFQPQGNRQLTVMMHEWAFAAQLSKKPVTNGISVPSQPLDCLAETSPFGCNG